MLIISCLWYRRSSKLPRLLAREYPPCPHIKWPTSESSPPSQKVVGSSPGQGAKEDQEWSGRRGLQCKQCHLKTAVSGTLCVYWTVLPTSLREEEEEEGYYRHAHIPEGRRGSVSNCTTDMNTSAHTPGCLGKCYRPGVTTIARCYMGTRIPAPCFRCQVHLL